jgi:hypothetical protein
MGILKVSLSKLGLQIIILVGGCQPSSWKRMNAGRLKKTQRHPFFSVYGWENTTVLLQHR